MCLHAFFVLRGGWLFLLDAFGVFVVCLVFDRVISCLLVELIAFDVFVASLLVGWLMVCFFDWSFVCSFARAVACLVA